MGSGTEDFPPVSPFELKSETPMTCVAIRRPAPPPTPEELIRRARDLVPEIRARAEETERNRTISPAIIAKVREAELLRTTRPKEFGGFELDPTVALEIALTISAACASTGWAVNGALSNGISFGHYPIETQRELWGDGADPFSCACFAPTGTAAAIEGGYVLNGKWSFASGVDHASWIRLGAFIKPPDAGQPADGAFFLLPTGEVEIEDNWFVYGLCGTGSKNIIVHDAFVPDRRVLRFADTRAGRTSGAQHHENPLYRLPLLVLGASMLASTAVGAAKGALADYLEMTTGRTTRGALAGGGLTMAEFATVQLRYAEAAAAVEAAELILMTDMRYAMAKLRDGDEVTVADRIRARRNQAYVTRLALQAVEALNASTGGAGLQLSNPIQRAWRDVNAVARHVSLNWDAVGTMYGQHAFGLEPRGQY
ncbi:MAG TPA: acyl-CoA dehydrogenase family protein [Stellaceae bacterium]|nr:acyl-CoA dehydrogenase family protein [Stellaceae bacterium]